MAAHFSLGDVVDVSDRNHQHFGKRGRITRRIYDRDAFAIECDETGDQLIVGAESLSFTKWRAMTARLTGDALPSAAEIEAKASARVLYKLREQASAHEQLAQILLPTTEAVQCAVNRRVAEILTGLADRYEKEADRG